jgi:predicted nucleotide-binding protein
MEQEYNRSNDGNAVGSSKSNCQKENGMANKRKQIEPKVELRLRMSAEDARKRLVDRIRLGNEYKAIPIQSEEQLKAIRNDYYKWNDYNAELLRQMFTNTDPADEYSGTFGFAFIGDTSLGQEIREFHQYLDRKLHRLDSISERLDLIPLSEEIQERLDIRPNETEISNSRVFIVHGHDELARETVARFLERLHVEVIILHEQASQGMTIIEKLEKYSDVGFAVVLLTPDDEGRKAAEGEVLKPRARQNVILELGYFVGKLARNRVVALYSGSLELPSDYLGVVFVTLDPGGGWRLELAKELKHAGFPIDMNDAM